MMAGQHRHQLSRLNIPGPSFHQQQPVQPMYSPSLPTAIQQSFHPAPPFNPQSALQTPMQASFFQPPGPPGRPMHRAHPSLALAAMGGRLPPGMPMTPLGQGQFPPNIMLGQPGQPYPQRRGRQPSVSIGGPPKAQLGGPGKNHVPTPLTPAATAATASATAVKTKKAIVSFPKETIPGEDGQPATHPEWARVPIPIDEVPEQPQFPPPVIATREIYPEDMWRQKLPDTIDVFLPGKLAWEDVKRQAIEEKLEKLGVEKGIGSYSTVPQIHAPHARAASISSPADPALLYFKLNKLQQSQNASQNASTAVSPQSLSVSPNLGAQLPPRLQNRHGYSLSLAQQPSSTYNPSGSFNPFGPTATLGSDAITPGSFARQDTLSDPGAPTDSSLAPPPLPQRADSRPDFVRGFGIEIPEEEEPPEDVVESSHVVQLAEDQSVDMELDEDETQEGSVTTAAHSRLHSRHVSRLSAALSLLSVGGQVDVEEPERRDMDQVPLHQVPLHHGASAPEVDDLDRDAVGEWTGSEDMRTGAESEEDEESIGEWSNPSDEERARNDRLQRRLMRKGGHSQRQSQNHVDHRPIETPRRLPSFPIPPLTTPSYALANATTDDENDMISNPSEDGRRGYDDGGYQHHRPLSVSSGMTVGRPLPPLPSSRPDTAQFSVHDPALAHSRRTSEQMFNSTMNAPLAAPQPTMPPPGPTLNPNAKPFVFGQKAGSGSFVPGTFGPSTTSANGSASTTPGHTRVPSLGKPLNPVAAEFKPGNFTFRLPTGAPQMPIPVFAAPPQHPHHEPPPHMPHPQHLQPPMQSQAPRPLPSPPAAEANPSPVRASQGREKRLRRGSSSTHDGASEDEGEIHDRAGIDNIKSFKFPNATLSPPTTKTLQRSAPSSPSKQATAVSAEAATLSANTDLSSSRPLTLPQYFPMPPKEIVTIPFPLPHPLVPVAEQQDHQHQRVESPEEYDESEDEAQASILPLEEVGRDLPIPPSMKARRAPIPLDFKHPVSTNTVPAGLFKALGNGNGEGSDERTRKSVRSRLSSREFLGGFDPHMHSSRPSLDDLNVPAISRKASRGRLVTDPVSGASSPWEGLGQSAVDGRRESTFAPQHQPRRRSSLPALHSSSSMSDSLAPALPRSSSSGNNVNARLELQQFEDRLESLFDEKIDQIRMDLQDHYQANASTTDGGALNPKTEAMINEVVSLFRSQLQESASRGLDDSTMDARGELDFQLVRDIVENGHAETRALMQQDLAEVLRRVQSQPQPQFGGLNVPGMMEEFHGRTMNTVLGAVGQLANRIEVSLATHNRPSSSSSHSHGVASTAFDREALVRELMAALVPHMAMMRSEPIDYDALTNQLSQAVKPHIAQLIDLASDKRETADLIVDKLLPVLPNIYPPVTMPDAETIISRITTEVRRIVAPADAHEIKEQVSDLVVERLDSRLAVRDRGLDALAGKVEHGVEGLKAPMEDVVKKIREMTVGQQEMAGQTKEMIKLVNSGSLKALEGLQGKLEGLGDLQKALLMKIDDAARVARERDLHAAAQPVAPPLDLSLVESGVEGLVRGQQSLQTQNGEILALHQDTLARLTTTLPESVASSSQAIQSTLADFVTRAASKQDLEELRRTLNSNAELQVQLAKARAAHGSVRVEKDVLAERATAAENERDRLRAQVDELQASMVDRAAAAAASEARHTELEEALVQALDRLKAADVASETQAARIVELDRIGRENMTEAQKLKLQVQALEMQANFANQQKAASDEALASLRNDHDVLLSQQSNWDQLNQATQQIEMLTSLMQQQKSNEPELMELRRVRDKNKALESDYAALQRRFKDQESKAASSDRAATAAKQSLTQAQQRAIEWEQRAKEYEAEVEEMRSRCDEAERRASDLETDHSLAKLQLDEKDADERLAQKRESKLRDQVASLEEKVARLQAEADKAKEDAKTAKMSVNSPPRPDSRASTVYPSRAATPTAPANGRPASRAPTNRTNTPPTTSVWDSMHAPKAPQASRYPHLSYNAHKQRSAHSYYRQAAASPTPSVVSVTPTQGEDGWWS